MNLAYGRTFVTLATALLLGAMPLSAQRATLRDPAKPFWKTHAPDTVTADIETSKGTITLQLIRDWAPAGVDRFYNLARAGFYDDSRFFRVIWGFIAQFGIAGNPAINQVWAPKYLPADPVREKNMRGTISFAQNKATDRATNVFINLKDNASLDSLKFVPIGRVVAGMDVADSIYAIYGETPTASPLWGGDIKRLFREGNRYLDEKFPKLDRIIKITVKQ